jgi:hypothetical protein
MRNIEGCTPLHEACLHSVSVEIIRRMVRMHPKALRMLDSMGRSPLRWACFPDRPSLELIRYWVNQCPDLCLLLNNDNETPYDQAAQQRRRRPAEVLSFLAESMNEAAIAFLVCSSHGMITLSSAATAHIQRVLLPNFATEGFSINYMSSNEHIRLLLGDRDTIRGLVRNTDIQSLLKDKGNHDLLSIIIPLVKAGSQITIDYQPMETKHHVSIFEAGSLGYS